MTRLGRALAAATIAVVLASCGSTRSNGISADASTFLRAQVAGARAAASAGHYADAINGVHAVERSVVVLVGRRAISQARAAEILGAAAALVAALQLYATPSVTPSTAAPSTFGPTTTAAPAPTQPLQHDRNKKHRRQQDGGD
jgi:hypothetical protein